MARDQVSMTGLCCGIHFWNGNVTPRKVNDFSNHDDSWLKSRMTDVLAIWMGSRSAVGLTVDFAAYLRVNIKVVGEKKLEERFGSKYLEYKQGTPFMLPRLWGREDE